MAQEVEHPKTAEEYVQLGNRLRKRGQQVEACQAYDKATRLAPESADAFSNWGDVLLRRSEYAEAVDKYLKAIKIDADSIDYDKWISALKNLDSREQAKATETFEEFVGTASSNASGYLGWAEALVRRQRYSDADEKFEKALALNVRYGVANQHWGDSLYEREDYSGAVKQYLAALRIDPSLLDYRRWQKTLDQLGPGESSKAEREFLQVAQKHPTDSLFSKWAGALVELERSDEADEKYKKAEEINIQDASIFRSRGDAFYGQGSYEKALAQYLEAIRIKPSAVDYKRDPAAVNYELWVNALKKVSRGAKILIIDGVRRVPSAEKSAAYRQWGDALFALSSYHEACQRYEQAAEVNESDFDVHNKWGLALVKLKSYREASKKYKRATERPNRFAEAYVNWGDLLYEQKEYAELVEKYLVAMEINHDVVDYDKWVSALGSFGVDEREGIAEKVGKLAKGKPPFATLYCKWGGALAAAGDYKSALVQYRKAAELDPESATTYLGWADALAKLEGWHESIGMYLKVLRYYADRVSLPELKSALRSLFLKLVPVLDHLEEAERERVIKSIEVISADSPNGAEVYHQWGNCLYRLRRLDEAVGMYKRALDLDHEYAKSIHNYGVILEGQGRYGEALEKYQEAVTIEPEDFTNYIAWGNALLAMNNYEGAIDKYQHAIDLKRHADVYIPWGFALSRAKDYDGALEKYKQAAEIEPNSARAYLGWGNVLAEIGCYDEAYEKFRKAIEVNPADINATYAAHNKGEYLFRQGRYAQGKRAWKKARQAYERTRQAAVKSMDTDYFQYYGNMVQTIFGELDDAEKIYLEGLEWDPDNIDMLTSLSSLHIEKKDESRNKTGGADTYWKARKYFQQAYGALTSRLKSQADSSLLLKLGQLLLSLGDYMTSAERQEAEEQLLKALATDQKSADILTNLGVLYARKKDFKRAIQYFSDALNIDPKDLNVWSNLAEAYLKAALEEHADPGLKEMAEKEFKQVLEVAPNHVESIIGLGEVYKAMGDMAKDEDLYLRAIELFLQGIGIADSDVGSKKLKRKELAAAYYSIGYSKVKLHEAAKPARGDGLLHEARDYFTMSFNDDPENYKAKRAVEKLDKRLTLSSSRLVDTFGPWLIFLAAISVFVVAQTIVIGKQPPFKDLEAKYYVLLSFGSLVFAIAGLYLPQLLKLKVAGIELEKSAVDQIATPGALGISK